MNYFLLAMTKICKHSNLSETRRIMTLRDQPNHPLSLLLITSQFLILFMLLRKMYSSRTHFIYNWDRTHTEEDSIDFVLFSKKHLINHHRAKHSKCSQYTSNWEISKNKKLYKTKAAGFILRDAHSAHSHAHKMCVKQEI